MNINESTTNFESPDKQRLSSTFNQNNITNSPLNQLEVNFLLEKERKKSTHEFELVNAINEEGEEEVDVEFIYKFINDLFTDFIRTFIGK